MSEVSRAGEASNGDEVVVTDEHLVLWIVTERNAMGVPGARGPRCLVFMSESAVRRLWSYPATWRYLSPRALLALSEER